MRGKVNKEEIERLVQQERNRHRAFAQQKEDEGGTKIETKLETKKKRIIMSLFNRGKLMFSQKGKIPMLGSQPRCSMGSYSWAFQFDDLMTFGQGISTIHNSIECR